MKPFLYATTVALLLSGCAKTDEPEPAITIDQSTVSLHYDQAQSFTLRRGSSTVDPASLTWSSSDTLIGTVSKQGIFKAKRVGKTTVTGRPADNGSSVTSEITVTPYSTAYTEPVVTFQVSKATVKGKETRTLLNETTDGLFFGGERPTVAGVTYQFNAGQYAASGVSLQPTQAVATDVALFLKERYTYLGTDEDIYVFADERGLLIGLTASDQAGLLVLYLPEPTGGRRPAGASAARVAAMKALLAHSQAWPR
ncbi:hypothetical protein GCM10027578_38630 [Spirosoma luteolum]